MKITFLLTSLLLLVTSVQAQEPSTDFLPFDRLGQSDIRVNKADKNDQQVVSASRTLKSVDELPFTIYVVTREEIFKNGYTTLVDVLKTVPGIKVSQPGSALEGETFLMRGLLGNGYTKILVNDLPIKPSVVSGMPIGAQLPIKEAERIEIIFGPGAAIYGADASAGVINIITLQTERPIYAQADLSIGDNTYNHLNIMFGGKIGKGKRLLKFTVYGSSTEYDTRNTNYSINDEFGLYNPENYIPFDTSYLSNPNYRGSLGSPQIGDIPHFSRSLGIHLKYRSLNFSFTKMYRRDHSAIGLHPGAVSYADAGTFTGEQINTFNLGINKEFRKWGFNSNVNYVGYRMDQASSTIFVGNTLSSLLDLFIDSETEQQQDSLANDNFLRFFSDKRYRYAESHDFNLEQLITLRPARFLEIIIGGNYRLSFTQPYIDYLRKPYEQSDLFDINGQFDFFNSPVFVDDELNTNFGFFTQLYLTMNRFNAIGGIRYDRFSLFGESVNVRLAGLYKLSPNVSIRASFANAFRAPSPFYAASTYLVQLSDLSDFTTAPLEVSPEKTFSYSSGIRAQLGEKVKADISFFYSETNSFISPFFGLVNGNGDPEDPTAALIGYTNDELSEIELYGLQSQITFDNIWEYWDLDAEITFNYNDGNEVLPFSGDRLNGVRMQPRMMGQFSFSFEALERVYLHVNNSFSSSWLSRNYISINSTEDLFTEDDLTVSGFHTLDLMGRLQLNPNFQIYLKATNITSRRYAGIGATGTLDDLRYNPQPTATMQLGLSYRMK